MKKLTGVLSIAIAGAMTCTMLASCGNNDTPTGKSEDESGVMRDISSMNLVKEMNFGWNLGNSLDVCNADRDGDGVANETADVVDETLWGNVESTKEMFEKLKEEGVNAVRIPVTWRDHLEDDNTINAEWMDRVQEVVDYAYDLDMYVIINIHHDGGDDAQFGAWVRDAANDYDTFYERYSSIWTQLCERYKYYSDHLIFESMNEVGFDNLPESDAYDLLNKINQDFVDLVRASGGNNEKRHLLIAGYWTDVDKTCSNRFVMPSDCAGRCILSVHYYTPWQFCVCNEQYSWGTDDEVNEMENQLYKLKTTFVDNGVPVIIGEYGTCYGNETSSRALFCKTFTQYCNDMGIAAFVWDDGSLFDRTNLVWNDEEIADAIKEVYADSNDSVIE